MRSFRTLDRRAGYSLASFSLLLAMVAPGLVPAFASADSLSSRSIALSSSAKSATNVSYEITFTPTTNANAFIVDFCNNSPIIGAECTAPTGFSTASGASTDTFADDGGSRFQITKTLTAATPVTVTVTGITNPSEVNDSDTGFYARITSYTTANIPVSFDSEAPGTYADNGGVALSINDTIGVSAAVRESMTFCVAGGSSAISANCGDAASNPPSVTLGDEVEGLGTTIAQQDLHTQISTNAAHGAIINLKSSTTGCGGLHRAGATGDCDIKPAVAASSLVNGAAFFGLKTGTDITSGSDGKYIATNGYSNSDWHLDFVALDAGGVTSSYGSPILSTDGGPANNLNMAVTFGASAANNTPAGNYSANLSMIASGSY